MPDTCSFICLILFQKLFGSEQYTPYVKDAFHRYIINGDIDAVSPNGRGTKVAAVYELKLKPGESFQIRVRLRPESETSPVFSTEAFDDVATLRKNEADEFYSKVISCKHSYSCTGKLLILYTLLVHFLRY